MSDDRPGSSAGASDIMQHKFSATGLSVSLTASDLMASVAWYRDVMGFTVEREFARDGVPFAVRLSAGSALILLTQDNGAKGAGRAKGEGCSFQLTTKQNVDDLAAHIKAHGVTLDSEPADAWGARVFRLRDPDGFKLVISSER